MNTKKPAVKVKVKVKVKTGSAPVMTGRIQSVKVLTAPSSPGAGDGKYERTEVGRFALWPVKNATELGALLFGRINIGAREGRLRMYAHNGASLSSPILKAEVLDPANNVVGEMALWDNTRSKSDKAPRYTGTLTFPRTNTSYSVSAWGEVRLEDMESSESEADGDAPF